MLRQIKEKYEDGIVVFIGIICLIFQEKYICILL